MKKIYQGSCHCKKINFTIEAEITHVRVCNCSICAKRGALIFRVEDKDFHLKNSLHDLRVYEWHSNTAKDYFCSICGILPFRKPRHLTAAEIEKGAKPFHGWAVNVRCLDDVDIESLPIIHIDGKSLE